MVRYLYYGLAGFLAGFIAAIVGAHYLSDLGILGDSPAAAIGTMLLIWAAVIFIALYIGKRLNIKDPPSPAQTFSALYALLLVLVLLAFHVWDDLLSHW